MQHVAWNTEAFYVFIHLIEVAVALDALEDVTNFAKTKLFQKRIVVQINELIGVKDFDVMAQLCQEKKYKQILN